MHTHRNFSTENIFRVILAVGLGVLLLAALLGSLHRASHVGLAAPIPPPEGYPKLRFSAKTVTPTLMSTSGGTHYYTLEIRNTGAYTAAGTTMSDTLPSGTTYNGDGIASDGSPVVFSSGQLSWQGDVGFDASVFINYSIDVSPGTSGTLQNTAVIDHALIPQPVTISAESVLTDVPLFSIAKTAAPALPGANKPLTYTLEVHNQGQPAVNLPLTVFDALPLNTTFRSIGPDGTVSPGGDVVTWTRVVSQGFGETSIFTFSVDVQDVPSGTVIANNTYAVDNPSSGVSYGQPYTLTVTDPVFLLSKYVWPDPPGSYRLMTYTLTVLNLGSLATNLVITDHVPAGVSYISGGSETGGVVTWVTPRLDTGETAEFSFTVALPDVADIPILNDQYGMCSAEGVCQDGIPLTSFVQGPNFEVNASLDPIAKKPGGGTGPVTPTMVVHNTGPGNALGATALLEFGRISVSLNDLITIPPVGNFSDGPECGSHCVAYRWVGSITAGETITFTTSEGQSTIGGAEGTNYTSTLVISDTLNNTATEPVTGTVIGHVTHLANLVPTKSGPPVIGRGLPLTYTIRVWNSGLSTEETPAPELEEVIPISTTFVSASDGGVAQTVGGETTISWTLPALSTGETLTRRFTVLVNGDLISGTQIINDNYTTFWYESEITGTGVLSITGDPVTTTVKEVGLIDSFKEVTPTLALPGPGNVLTHIVHIVNTSPASLSGVTVYDVVPWEYGTYQRDADASAGQVISDIVSISWTGDVGPFSEEVITFTSMVDPDYQGAITNTATIAHASLTEDVIVQSVAYITDEPVLQITKTASPDPVRLGNDLSYSLKIVNLGQQATELVVLDTLPENASFVPGSATSGGLLVGDQIRWDFPVLDPGKQRTLGFEVTVQSGLEVINANYNVASAEGVTAFGVPVITPISGAGNLYLPLITH